MEDCETTPAIVNVNADDSDRTNAPVADQPPSHDQALTDDELRWSLDAMSGVYIERPENRRAEALLRRLMFQVQARRRQVIPPDMLREGEIMIVYGDSRVGKSALIQRMLNGSAGLRATEGSQPLVNFQVKSPASIVSVAGQILQNTGYPVRGKLSKAEIWPLVYDRFEEKHCIVINVGEALNLINSMNKPDATILRDIVRSVTINERCPMVVILSGLPGVYDFLMEDEQLEHRLSFVNLGTMGPEHARVLQDGIKAIAEVVGLQIDEDDLVAEIVPRLMHVSRRALGLAMEIAVKSAMRALAPEDEHGIRLPPDHVLERRHFAAHHGERTGNADFANAFLARNWDTLDPRRKGIVFPSQVVDTDEGEGRKGRRR